MIEDLQQARDAWIHRLVTYVCERWGHEVEPELLAPHVQTDPLVRALALSKIAEGDTRAWPPTVIAEDLRTVGLLADVPIERAVSGLVLPVVRILRREGAPWARWWDVAGLFTVLLELWIGGRKQEISKDDVAAELIEVWGISEDFIKSLIRNSSNPFMYMPPDLLRDSPCGPTAQVLRELVETYYINLDRHEKALETHPELVKRPDLAEVARRFRHWRVLQQALPLLRGIPQSKRQAITQDLECFDRQMSSLVHSLTGYEVRLIRGVEPDELYRYRCLVAAQGIYEQWLLNDDSLPPAIEFCSGGDVPQWIHDEVVAGGGRTSRTNVGPHPLWLATAETPAHEASIRMLSIEGAACKVGHEIKDDEVVLWLILPLAPGDPGPAARVPFIYSLDIVNGAWQLLHLSAVGRVRLTAVRLTDEGEPRLIGAKVLTLPPDACAELGGVATTALRTLVGDNLQSILWRRGTEGLDQQAKSAFRGNETAKGEDLRDEFILPLEHNAHPVWDEFREAARELARARSQLATAVLDGLPDSSLREGVAAAVESRQRALEVARADPRSDVRTSRHAEDLARSLPSDHDAFVHLFVLNDRLSAVIGRVVGGQPHFELLPYSDVSVERLTRAVDAWSRLPHARVGQEWYRYFGMLITAFEGLIRLLAEALERHGITKVFLSPTTPLDLLPLHAVPLEDDRAVFLGDVLTDVAYIPTAHMLRAVTQTVRRPATCPAVVIGHGRSAVFEAEMVAGIHEGATLLTEEAATPGSVLCAITGARIVHITSHGFTHSNRWASGVELSGNTRGASTLTTSRILAEADLSSADLVVLNACRTGTHVSTARIVQTLRGVESAFLARGAKAVISTLWEITNLHAAVFSVLLHANLAEGASVGDSYRAAISYLRHGQWQSTTRQEWRTQSAEMLLDETFDGVLDDWREHLTRQAKGDPFFWAAFKITGSI